MSWSRKTQVCGIGSEIDDQDKTFPTPMDTPLPKFTSPKAIVWRFTSTHAFIDSIPPPKFAAHSS